MLSSGFELITPYARLSHSTSISYCPINSIRPRLFLSAVAINLILILITLVFLSRCHNFGNLMVLLIQTHLFTVTNPSQLISISHLILPYASLHYHEYILNIFIDHHHLPSDYMNHVLAGVSHCDSYTIIIITIIIIVFTTTTIHNSFMLNPKT